MSELHRWDARRLYPYPSADAASAGGDLEVSVQVLDGSAGEEALHHQQDAVDEESRGDAVDHILDDVDPEERIENHWKHSWQHTVTLCWSYRSLPGGLTVGRHNVVGPKSSVTVAFSSPGCAI